MKRGSWVCSHDQIGLVKYVHDDGHFDIIIFDRKGNRVGRTSPIMGGPSTFEPWCSPENWHEIKEPSFPLRENYYLKELVEFV